MAGPQPKLPNDKDPSLGIPPKQFLSLDGIPILIHSLRAFAAVKRVTAIYVAVRKTEMERVQAQIAEYGFACRAHVVEGGDNAPGVRDACVECHCGRAQTMLCWYTTQCGR